MHTWDEYKTLTESSRKIIAVPAIIERLGQVSGQGIDLGCGDGDVSALVQQAIGGEVIGVDRDESRVVSARSRASRSLSFVAGDLANRVLSKIGVRFSFAFSNCCYSHMPSAEVVASIDDARACLSEGALFVILVPHWRRAEERYRDVVYTPDGITAVPDFDGRQHFRRGEWYCKVLSDAGFTIKEHKTILIPDDPGLSDRYRQDVGKPIFSCITAVAQREPGAVERAKKAFDVAHDNRKFEIDMFWKRSLFFWGFIAAAFVGFVATGKSSSLAGIIFASFGFVCSIIWAAGNRGSKYWQEYWEEKVVLFQNAATGDIFVDHFPRKPSTDRQFSPRRLSVSKLIIGISDYAVVAWTLILIHVLIREYGISLGAYKTACVTVFVLMTFAYGVYLLRACRSED